MHRAFLTKSHEAFSKGRSRRATNRVFAADATHKPIDVQGEAWGSYEEIGISVLSNIQETVRIVH